MTSSLGGSPRPLPPSAETLQWCQYLRREQLKVIRHYNGVNICRREKGDQVYRKRKKRAHTSEPLFYSPDVSEYAVHILKSIES